MNTTNDDLARIARNEAVLNTNLYNAGLTLPTCGDAYRAALFVGANAEQAFEAARFHMMLALYPRDIETQTQRLYQSGARDEEAGRRCRKLARVEATRALPNPFALQVAA
jgi:hypothetical protein